MMKRISSFFTVSTIFMRRASFILFYQYNFHTINDNVW